MQSTQPDTSPRFTINSIDTYKVARGFLVTFLGAFIPFVAGVYMDWDYHWMIRGQEYDFSLFLTAVIGSLLEIGRRWVSDNK